MALAGSKWLSVRQLMGMTGQRILLPFYHAVSDQEKPHFSQLYPVKSVAEFKEDLDFITKHYDPISLQELIEIITSNKKVRKPVFHLTFDDGLSEFYSEVAPILLERKIPATVFINTDFLDNQKMFYRFKASILADKFAAKGMLECGYESWEEIDEFAKTLSFDFDAYLREQQPYLTKKQVKELIGQGFTIGGHSVSHPLYTNLDLESQLKETLDSVNFVKKEFELDYAVFSFPFTDEGVSSSFYEQVNTKLELTFGTAGLKKDIHAKNVQRIGLEQEAKAESIIKYQYLYYWFKSFVGKNTIKRQRFR